MPDRVTLPEDPVSLQAGEGVIRCPAIRSLIKEKKLAHDGLRTASVSDLMKVLSGTDRSLGPAEAGSLANVAGLFAILNHAVRQDTGGGSNGFVRFFRSLFGRGREIRDAGLTATGAATDRRFDLNLRTSRGNHPGTVDVFDDDDDGQFNTERFDEVVAHASDGVTLTIEDLARLIIKANGRVSGGGEPLDLAKSSGEWALMVCVLRPNAESTRISIADLRRMFSQADSSQLLRGSRSATARDWIEVTAKIAAAIAQEQAQLTPVIGELHQAFTDFNILSGEPLCPCVTCNPEVRKRLSEREPESKS